MDLQVLHTELVNDPLNLQYSTKTDQECAAALGLSEVTATDVAEAKAMGV